VGGGGGGDGGRDVGATENDMMKNK